MEEFLKIVHEVVYLVLWTVPVLGRKSIEAGVLDIELTTEVIDLNQTTAGFFVAKVTWKSAEVRPAAISIHYESYVVKLLF